jgi:hypothetical protein
MIFLGQILRSAVAQNAPRKENIFVSSKCIDPAGKISCSPKLEIRMAPLTHRNTGLIARHPMAR